MNGNGTGSRYTRRWDKSHCNPHNTLNPKDAGKCGVPEYILTIPERPEIVNVRGIYTDYPFIKVPRLRTPIDKLVFIVEIFAEREATRVGTHVFDTFNYQNYAPDNLFYDGLYYAIRCVAINEAGISPVSNRYIVDLLDTQHKIKWQKIRCDKILFCDVPILCG